MLEINISEVMCLDFSSLLFSYFTWISPMVSCKERDSENRTKLPDEKQKAVAWLLASLSLAELLVPLCVEPAASEPWPAAACAAGGAELSWSGWGTWRVGWEVSCLVAVSLGPSQGSWAYVVEFPYLQLPKNLFGTKINKRINKINTKVQQSAEMPPHCQRHAVWLQPKTLLK